MKELHYYPYRLEGDESYHMGIRLGEDGFQAWDNRGWVSRFYAREQDAEVACDDRLDDLAREHNRRVVRD